MNNPRASDAVVVASDYRIYLTSYVGSSIGESGIVTTVDPGTNIETLLLKIETASSDMFIDEDDDILIIGSSDKPDAKSSYMLPSGNYLNPTVLKTGLGRTWCISKHGEYVYFSDRFSIKRFRYPDGAIETFLEKPVDSMSFSLEHLYYADLRNGVVGRINIQTKADEVLASGLNGPIAVRYDESTGNLYFLEKDTVAGRFKDGTLKTIHRVTTDSNRYYRYEWRDVYLEKGNYEVAVRFEGDSAHKASNTSTTQVTAQYRVEVVSKRGVASGSGWYRQGATATVSGTPTVIEEDFFTMHVFEGWVVEGVVVSTSPTYSFIVDKTITLTASWRTEMNLVNIGIVVGVILLIVVVSTVLAARRKHVPLPPPPPPPPPPRR